MFGNTISIGQWSVASWVKREKDTSGEDEGNDDEDVVVDHTGKVSTDATITENNADSFGNRTANKGRIEFDPKLKLKQQRNFLKKFLDSLLRMEPHYCRQSTSKFDLEPIWQLTFNSLYKFYDNECKNNDEIPLSYKTFSQVFQSLNLSLFLLKKDKCNICCGYSAGNEPDEEDNQRVSKKIKVRE
ncbi:hypothetical protein PR048_032100 [Dryococelus australis]|uniref:Uncharacterized protein n=1 Tax=Dryococelus australis TaxID=614101 RepID=A0ABQ9G193_9NEOP|nr:hypothetical protein PR048_032100 [Dryococelus australis]